MNNLHPLLLVVVISLVTIVLRAIPFIFLGKKKETPKYIQYLGNILPYAIIGMLVVYCFKDMSFSGGTYGIPEAVAVLVIIASYRWKRNTIVSFLSGTVGYMILTNLL